MSSRTRHSKSIGLFNQSNTSSLDDRESSRPRPGSADTTMIGVSLHWGSSRKRNRTWPAPKRLPDR